MIYSQKKVIESLLQYPEPQSVQELNDTLIQILEGILKDTPNWTVMKLQSQLARHYLAIDVCQSQQFLLKSDSLQISNALVSGATNFVSQFAFSNHFCYTLAFFIIKRLVMILKYYV